MTEPAFDRYSKDADITIRGDDWFRSYDERKRHSAACGSNALREACLKFFRRFEREHRLREGDGMKFQLEGYRA